MTTKLNRHMLWEDNTPIASFANNAFVSVLVDGHCFLCVLPDFPKLRTTAGKRKIRRTQLTAEYDDNRGDDHFSWDSSQSFGLLFSLFLFFLVRWPSTPPNVQHSTTPALPRASPWETVLQSLALRLSLPCSMLSQSADSDAYSFCWTKSSLSLTGKIFKLQISDSFGAKERHSLLANFNWIAFCKCYSKVL